MIMCYCRFAYAAVGTEHLHAQAVFGVSPDVTLYASVVFHEVTPHQGIITAVSGFVEKLCTEMALGLW